MKENTPAISTLAGDASFATMCDWCGSVHVPGDNPSCSVTMAHRIRVAEPLCTDCGQLAYAFRRALRLLAERVRDRDDLTSRLRHWAEMNELERARGKMPTFLNPHTVAAWTHITLTLTPPTLGQAFQSPFTP